MNINGIKLHNYELFLDGVASGAIPYSYVDGLLEVGSNQPNEFITSFTGGPYLPDNDKLPKSLAGMSLGSGGKYPKPFLSLGQRYNNGVYSNVGPYARMVRYKKYLSRCINDECGTDPMNVVLWGRLGVIAGGAYSGQWGFFIQDWYNHDDGNYGPAFWSERYNMDPPIPDKKTWWDQCTKTTVEVRLYNDPLREKCEIEVAYQNLEFDDDQYFPGEDIRSLNDGSVNILMVFAQLAQTLGGWI